MKINCNVLWQENAELQTELETANKRVDDHKILVKKYRELKDKQRYDTAEVCKYKTVLHSSLANTYM